MITYFLLDIDTLLRKYSRELFPRHGYDYKAIIETITKEGPISIKRLTYFTIRHANHRFDRWGIGKRMEGSPNLVGLIPAGYAYKIKINKKESRYGLTLKGFLCSLQYMPFEKTHHVKNFKKILADYKESQLQKWILDFIKYEIALILFFNYIQGQQWDKFKFIQSYLKELKKPRQIITPYFLNLNLMDSEQKSQFQFIRKEYLKLYYLIYLFKPNMSDEKNKELIAQISKEMQFQTSYFSYHDQILKFIREWYVYLGYTDIEEAEEETIENLLSVNDPEFRDPIGWFDEQSNAYINAKNLLIEKGLKIPEETVELGDVP